MSGNDSNQKYTVLLKPDNVKKTVTIALSMKHIALL